MKIEIVHHYRDNDQDCIGDYVDVEIFIDGNLIREYGDWYHDRGGIKADAFVEGLRWAIEDCDAPDDTTQVRRTDVADRETR